ncbi:MAG: hypothetical protein EXQ47_03995 [Bryobacterales bacterium]|nr:hypothetical protein [Bryobacterales bacterium]
MSRRQVQVWAAAVLSAGSLFAANVDSRLAYAAKARNTAGVRTLLQQKVDVNSAQVNGMTALHWAAYQDDLETAKLLVAAGANAKALNRYGVTPLSSACENGNGAMVELLLKAGAAANTTLPGGETVLMTAARTGKVPAIKALLAHGANPNAKEPRTGQTALMWAAAEGNAPAVEALMEGGADRRAREFGGFTPLLYAIREGRAEVVHVLLKAGVDVNEKTQNLFRPRQQSRNSIPPKPGTNALALAVVNGHLSLASELLDAGADPNSIEQGWTPLHALTWVRKAGAGDNQPPPQGSGTMTSRELIKKLVDKGANLNVRMPRNSSVGMTRLNTKGATPFFLAARTADAEMMRYLAQLGADPKIPNDDGSTPLMAVAGLGTRSPGEDAGTEPEVMEALQVALELGNDINAVDAKGETAMHGAAYKDLPGAVEFLAAKGARIDIWNKKNKMGWTPLWIARGHRFGNFKPSPETIEALEKVMKAAGVSITDNEPSVNCDTHSKEDCPTAK